MASSEYIMVIIKDVGTEKVKEMRKNCEFSCLVDVLQYFGIPARSTNTDNKYKSFSFKTSNVKLAKEFIPDWLMHVEYVARYFVPNYYVTDLCGRLRVYHEMKKGMKIIEVTDTKNNVCDLIVYTKRNDKDEKMLIPIGVWGHMNDSFKEVYNNHYN